jgi:probable F420-dependent oxidoreductase
MPYGLTIPLGGVTIREHTKVLDILAGAGYTDVWSSEVNGNDAFTPLVAAVTSHPQFRVGTAIVPAYTRAPALLAMSAASLADAADGDVLLGIGSSSDVIVERWNGVPFVDPYQKVKDVVTFIDRALTGEPVTMDGSGFSIKGFRLGLIPKRRPKILIAALRPGMLRLAGRISDGAIINWLSATDVAKVVPYVQEGRDTAPEIAARIFVICSTDIDAVRTAAKRSIAAYLNVGVYAQFHEWLGRGDVLEEMWKAWRSGDRKAALAAIPDYQVDELFVHGDPASCREQIAEYVKHGVTTPVLAVSVLDGHPMDVLAELGPAADADPRRLDQPLS